jgi:hypothetical protein
MKMPSVFFVLVARWGQAVVPPRRASLAARQ